MDNYEYLQRISQSNRPLKKTPKDAFSSINGGLILKILIGGILATAVLIAIGIIINAGPSRATDLTQQLYTRMNNVNQIISEYNKSLKSSQLRSINYSLSGAITGASSQLGTYISAVNSETGKVAKLPADLAAYEAGLTNHVSTTLADAKLNGTLDRIYAAQIHMQVSLLLSLTSELLGRDKDPRLHNILDGFYSNLNVIEQTLNNYASS